ncbi:unnamed protein product [Hyaloperonospora brassicae]|uniref:Tetratricopeptide repeat protein n=1 Tax=Hyaloperonospora brassicae TaxID=162125 RepID=A0AAV0U6E1_HYABA|nr:unnamed protein product [Hyaloperonospora brassicae]
MAHVPDDAELLRPDYRPRLGALSVAEKLAQAELLKRRGNLFVRAGDYRRALRAYAHVFAYVNGLSVAGDAMAPYAQSDAGAHLLATAAEGQQIEALQVATWANMALCHVRLGGAPHRALQCCGRVLALAPQHSKARFRQAQALAQDAQYARARAVLQALLDEEPANAAVRRELRQLQATARADAVETRAREKRVFGRMFPS